MSNKQDDKRNTEEEWKPVVPDLEKDSDMEEEVVFLGWGMATPDIAKTIDSIDDTDTITDTGVIEEEVYIGEYIKGRGTQETEVNGTSEFDKGPTLECEDEQDDLSKNANLKEEKIMELPLSSTVNYGTIKNESKIIDVKVDNPTNSTTGDEEKEVETTYSEKLDELHNNEYLQMKKKVFKKRLIATVMTGIIVGATSLGVYKFVDNSFLPVDEILKQVEQKYKVNVIGIKREDNGLKDFMLEGSKYNVTTKDGFTFTVHTEKDSMLKETLKFSDKYPKELKRKEVTSLVFSTQGELRNYNMYLTDSGGVHLDMVLNKEGNEVANYSGSVDMYYKHNTKKGWGTMKGEDYANIAKGLSNFSFLLSTLDINMQIVVPNDNKSSDIISKKGYATILEGQFIVVDTFKIKAQDLIKLGSGETLQEYVRKQKKNK